MRVITTALLSVVKKLVNKGEEIRVITATMKYGNVSIRERERETERDRDRDRDREF